MLAQGSSDDARQGIMHKDLPRIIEFADEGHQHSPRRASTTVNLCVSTAVVEIIISTY